MTSRCDYESPAIQTRGVNAAKCSSYGSTGLEFTSPITRPGRYGVSGLAEMPDNVTFKGLGALLSVLMGTCTYMLGTVITIIFSCGQQTVSVVCNTARVFSKSGVTSTISKPPSTSDEGKEQYVVPLSGRTFTHSKYNALYEYIADVAHNYRLEDDMLGILLAPQWGDKIMMVVDLLAHINKGLSRSQPIKQARRRFTREQRHTIWMRSLRVHHVRGVPRIVVRQLGTKLQADEGDVFQPDLCHGNYPQQLDTTAVEDDRGDESPGITKPDDASDDLMQHMQDDTNARSRALDDMTMAIERLRNRSGAIDRGFDTTMNMAYEHSDWLLPIAIFMYNIYRSRNVADAVVAVVNFAEKVSSRDGHTRARLAATWATSYFNMRKSEVVDCVTTLCDHFRTDARNHLIRAVFQSDDYISAFARITEGISKNSHVRAFVYLIAFAFMGISASIAGVSPDINEFSKQAMAISTKIDMTRTNTGMTLGLLSQAVRLSAELCSSFMHEGFQAFWSSDAKRLRTMLEAGKVLLLRAEKFSLIWTPKEMSQYGMDLKTYIDDYGVNKPRYEKLRAGASVAGLSFSSETNLAILWSDVRRVSDAIVAAYEDYKAILSSVAFRKAPQCIALIAGSSVGKTSVTQYIAKWCLLYDGLEDDMKYVYTVNPNQEFLDGYHPWQNVFVLDDVATVRAEYMKTGDPQVLGLIQYVNNVSMLTNQADLSRKDSTPFLSRYVMVTSNKFDLNAHKYAENFPAILRRVKWFIEVDVDPAYATQNHTLDSPACTQWYSNGGVGFPPFWRFTIKLCEVHNNGARMHNTFKVIHTGLDANGLQEWLRNTTDEHWRVQDTILHNVSSSGRMKMCPTCRKLTGSVHSNDCPERGTTVQSYDDVCVVAGTVAASVATAAISATIVSVIYNTSINLYCHMLRAYRVYVKQPYNNMIFAVTYGVAVLSDVGYTIALAREGLRSSGAVGASFYSIVVRVAQALALWCIPWTWCAALYVLCAHIPPRSAVIGRVITKDWLKPLVAVGLGAVAITAVVKHMSKVNRRPGKEHADEADFSAYEHIPAWGHGRRKPYEGESLVTTWSSSSKCTSGSSHSGVMEMIRKNVFIAAIKSDGSMTRGNGFVYRDGFIVVNAHSLRKHKNKIFTITLAYTPQDTDLGAAGVEKPRNYVMGKIDPDHVFYMSDRDLAMIWLPAETRKGLSKYVVEAGSSNYGMDPHLAGRELNGEYFYAPLAYQHTISNSEYGERPNSVFIKHAIHYKSRKQFKGGHSGGVYVVHSGNMAQSEYGYLGLAGMHMGVSNTVDDTVGFATAFDASVLREMHEQLLKQVTHQNRELSTTMGDLAPAFVRSTTFHADVVVEDSVFDLQKGSVGGRLGATHPKSAVSWLDYDAKDAVIALTVYGGICGDSRKSQGVSSSYYPTPWSTGMCEVGHHEVLGDLSNNYLPAKVSQADLWQVHRACLLDLCGGDIRGPDTEALNAAVAGYVSDVIERVDRAGNNKSWSIIQPLSYEEVINGRDAVFDGIVKKTGGGFGYSGPKSKHVKTLDEPIPGLHKTGTHWTFDDDVMQSVREADEMLRAGKDPRFVYTCHLKDEVRGADKVKNNKVRMICGASIPCIVLMRKYLLTLILFMQQNPIATECAVGLNVESKQWSDLGNYLRAKGGDDRYIAGDHKNFDKNQTFPISYAASRVMLLMVEHANLQHGRYDAGDLLAVKTLLLGLCHPTYDFFGVLVRVLGTNPSGNSLTAQRNCIVNSLYMRCAFIVAAKMFTGTVSNVAVRWYSKAVAQINYGDDLVASVASGFKWFNHDVVTRIMQDWGLVFTHADKSETVGRPYEHFNSVTFLKRSWVYDNSIKGYLAPLDPTSLVKSLHYYHRGGSLSIVQQQVCLIRDVAENALNYGEQQYNQVCHFLRGIAQQAGFAESDYAEATSFTTYDDYVERYKRNSESNHRFVTVPCDIQPPKMLECVDPEYRSLVES